MMDLSDSERMPMIVFSRFDTKHACDGRTDRQTDRQTDGIAVAYRRYSILLYRVGQKSEPQMLYT